jgi:hypothetical protein
MSCHYVLASSAPAFHFAGPPGANARLSGFIDNSHQVGGDM